MIKLLAVVLSVLFASPALASNELRGATLSKLAEMGEKHGVVIEKLNAADTAAMDEATNERPKPSMIYLLTLGNSVIIALVHEGKVIFSTDPVDLETVNKMLGRTGV